MFFRSIVKVLEFVRIFGFRYKEIYQADSGYPGKKGNEAPKLPQGLHGLC